MGLREYARRRGVALRAVQKAVETGRLSKCLVPVEYRGAITHRIADAALADREWDANSDHAHRSHGGGVLASAAGEERATAAPTAAAGAGGDLPPELRAGRVTGPPTAPKGPRIVRAEPGAAQGAKERPAPDPEDGEFDAGEIHDGMTFASANRAHKVWEARQAKLKHEQAAGRLVEADKVRAEAFRVARTVRDSMLNVADRIADQVASLTDPVEVHRVIDAEVRRALEGMAAAEAGGSAGG